MQAEPGPTDGERLDRYFETNSLWIPARIDLARDPARPRSPAPDRLIWNDGGKGRWTRPGPGLLERFVDLTRNGEASPRAIEQYARRWGVLEICEHALPRTHNPRRREMVPWFNADPSTAVVRSWEDGCYPLGYVPFGTPMPKDRTSPRYECWEPLRSWGAASRRARAVLDIAASLHQNARGNGQSWHALMGGNETFASWAARRQQTELPDDGHIRRYYGSRINEERARLGGELNQWLELGDVRPALTWGPGPEGPHMRTRIHGLFGAIALQLVLAVGRTEALAICSNCARSYLPKRRPVAGKRRYCETCRADGIPVRDAMADRRKRSKETGEVHRGKTRQR